MPFITSTSNLRGLQRFRINPYHPVFPDTGSFNPVNPPSNPTGDDEVLLNAITINNTSPNIDDLSSITSTYPWYEIVMINLLPTTTANTLYLQFSQSGVVQSGANNYRWGDIEQTSTGVPPDITHQGSTGDTQMSLSPASILNLAAYGGISGIIRIDNPLNITFNKLCSWRTWLDGAAGAGQSNIIGSGSFIANTLAITGFRLSTGLGDNWVSGTVEVYGKT